MHLGTTDWLAAMPEGLPPCAAALYRAMADSPDGPHGVVSMSARCGLTERATAWTLSALIATGAVRHVGATTYAPVQA